MKEIGSEFWNVPVTDKKNFLLTNNLQWFLSGRLALRYIIQDIKSKTNVHTVAMPSWCCDSMITPFIEEEIKVLFYPVTVKNGVLNQNLNVVADIILVLDYFGVATNNDYKNFPGIVIRDLTHGVFSNNHVDADYYFGSLRKWCGIWTGGFAYTKHKFKYTDNINSPNEQYLNLRKLGMKQKEFYIKGMTKEKKHLEYFEKAELLLDTVDNIETAAARDIEKIQYLDIKNIQLKRKKNATLVQNMLEDILLLPKNSEKDCPLFVPVIIKNREKIRKKLIENDIYCPVHWPITEYHRLSNSTRYIYDHELSIVCDQRYEEDDMVRICELILKEI